MIASVADVDEITAIRIAVAAAARRFGGMRSNAREWRARRAAAFAHACRLRVGGGARPPLRAALRRMAARPIRSGIPKRNSKTEKGRRLRGALSFAFAKSNDTPIQ